MNNEIKWIILEEELITEANYPFTVKPNFSTLRSIIKISKQRPLISFTGGDGSVEFVREEQPIFSFLPDDSIRDLLGFN